MVLAGFILNCLFCLIWPIALGVWLWRRLELPWGWFFGGMVVFVASQVVHIPLNWGVGQLFQQGILPTPPEVAKAVLLPLALGLSAGICEETARYIGLTVIWKKARGWAAGVFYGAGHGGIEALIVGVVAALTVINLVVLQDMDVADLVSQGVPEAQATEIVIQVEQAWATPWWMTVLGAWERFWAITCHIFMSVLVMHSVTRKTPWGFLGALTFHAALDAGVVAVMGMESLPIEPTVAAEIAVFAFGAVALGGILWLREDHPPQDPEEEPLPELITPRRVGLGDEA